MMRINGKKHEARSVLRMDSYQEKFRWGGVRVFICVEVLLIAALIWTVLAVLRVSVIPTSSRDVLQNPVFALFPVSGGPEILVRRGMSQIVRLNLEHQKAEILFDWKDRTLTNVAVSRDGTTLIQSIDSQKIYVFREGEPVVFEEVGQPKRTSSSVSNPSMTALSANGEIAIHVVDGQFVRRWDLLCDSAVATDFEFVVPAKRIVLDSDGGRLLVAFCQGDLSIHHSKTGELLQRLGSGDPLTAAPVISEDDKSVVVIRGRTVERYELPSGRMTWKFQSPEPDQLTSLAISPDGHWIAVRGVSSKGLILDASDGTVQRTLAKARGLGGLAFSASSDVLYSGRLDGAVSLWSVADGHEIQILPVP